MESGRLASSPHAVRALDLAQALADLRRVPGVIRVRAPGPVERPHRAGALELNMYRCHFCKTVSQPNTLANRVVLETRPTEYPSRPKAQRRRIGRKIKTFDDPGGAGYEIAREVLSCRSCAERHAAEQVEEPAFA